VRQHLLECVARRADQLVQIVAHAECHRAQRLPFLERSDPGLGALRSRRLLRRPGGMLQGDGESRRLAGRSGSGHQQPLEAMCARRVSHPDRELHGTVRTRARRSDGFMERGLILGVEQLGDGEPDDVRGLVS